MSDRLQTSRVVYPAVKKNVSSMLSMPAGFDPRRPAGITMMPAAGAGQQPEIAGGR
jgi:hypothetical protein